jgi:hypothetical protein
MWLSERPRVDRSKRRQRFICSWTTLIAPTPRKRQNPEDINRLPFLITRRQDNGLAPFNSARGVAIFPRIRGPAGTVSSCRNANAGKNAIQSSLCAHWQYDSLICQVSGHLGCNDQYSAGRYPLISRPTHTSTSVGVVHNMSAFPLWLWGKSP